MLEETIDIHIYIINVNGCSVRNMLVVSVRVSVSVSVRVRALVYVTHKIK